MRLPARCAVDEKFKKPEVCLHAALTQSPFNQMKKLISSVGDLTRLVVEVFILAHLVKIFWAILSR